MFKAVIPARHASSRLPGKPLLDIGGKPMVVRVAEQALQSQANEILVATDHPDIVSACQQHNIPVLLTRSDWPTGTDRLAEVVKHCNWPYSLSARLLFYPTMAQFRPYTPHGDSAHRPVCVSRTLSKTISRIAHLSD
jgi:hypothetical protein